MSIVQWVNLEKNQAYANDPDIGSVERCGPLSVKALFAKNGIPLSFSVKAVPVGDSNVEYSDAEQRRNENFRMPNEISGLATAKEVLLDGAVKLPAAGGNKYKLEAKDANGATVESVEIETKRKMYYQFMYMDDGVRRVTPYPLTQMEQHCLKNKITLTKVGTDKKLPFRKTVSMHDGGRYHYRDFGRDVKNAYDIDPAHKKIGCVAALSGYIATKKRSQLVRPHTIGSPPKDIKIEPDQIIVRGESYLWHGLDDEEDKVKDWFVNGLVEYMNTEFGGSAPIVIPIARKSVDIIGSPRATYGGYKHISIKICDEIKSLIRKSRGIISFTINLNVVKGFSGGFSWNPGGAEFITCSTKSWWEDNPSTNSDVIWNHEIGHRMGMVTYGDKDHSATNSYFIKKLHLPDSPPTLYGENRRVNDKGHEGPHCEKGVMYDPATDTWSGTPGCVLFGATGTATARSPLDYCEECSKAIQKIDLS